MKHLLLLSVLLLISLSGKAQFGGLSGSSTPVPTVKTLTYRATNSNELDLTLKSGGVQITPTSSQTIAGEIRALGQDKVLYTVLFASLDTSGTLKTMLPNLSAGSYTFGLLWKKAGVADFRTVLANLTISRVGTVAPTLTSVNGLSVSLNNTGHLDIMAYLPDVAGSSASPKTYALTGVGPVGYQITHNRNTRYILPLFLRQDTGALDYAWRIKIINANTVEVVGVQGETMTGQLELTFLFPTSAN